MADCQLKVHIIPDSSIDEVIGLHDGRLKIRITAPPVDGKANLHLIAFLAKAFGVPKKRVHILQGETSKKKTVHIDDYQKSPNWLTYLEQEND